MMRRTRQRRAERDRRGVAAGLSLPSLPAFWVILVLLVGTGWLVPEKLEAQQARPAAKVRQWEKRTLGNGLEVIVIENRSVPLVTIEIAVRNGAYTETPEYNGLSHLYEHMFFKSNERSGEAGKEERLAELGMLSNATTREEVVNYYTTTIKAGTREAMEHMRDAIRYPVFDAEELRQEIQVVLDELAQHRSNPFYYLVQAVDSRLWYRYPSRKNAGGSPETVAKATPEMMRQIQRKYYLPNNAAVVVAGDVETAEIFRLAEKIFGDWPRGEDPFLRDPVPRHPPLERDAVAIVHQPVNAATIQFGYHGPSTDTDPAATYAADVFSFILRQPNSRFSRELIDSGLTTGASLSYYTQRNVGPIALMAQTNPDRLKEAITAINRQISLFTTPDYFTEEELESAKTLLDVNEIYDREKPSEYAHTVSFWWASTGLDYYETYVERLRRVTRADIARYVETYLWKKPRVVAVLLSESDHQRIGLREADLLVREPDLPAKKGREMRKGSRPSAPLP